MKKNKTVEYGKYGLMFLIPFFLVFLIFQLYPLIYTFYNSFIYSAKNGRYVTTSVGLGNFTNYVFAKTGSEFWQALAITVVLWLVNFVPQILLALVLAAWFTDIKVKIKGQGVFKVSCTCLTSLQQLQSPFSSTVCSRFRDLSRACSEVGDGVMRVVS